jgi:hypothetical protein
MRILESNSVLKPSGTFQTYTLVYKGRNLLKVTQPANLKYFQVRFDDVALDATSLIPNLVTGRTDTVIKGFIILEATLKKGSQLPNGPLLGSFGWLICELEEKSVMHQSPNPVSKYQVSVTLDSIQCYSVNDNGGDEDIIGFTGVRIKSPNILPSGVTIEGHSGGSLLWSRVDGEPLRLRSKQVARINKTLTFTLVASDSLFIVADLNEDDDNDDGNPNALDTDNYIEDEDDYLEPVKIYGLSNFSPGYSKKVILPFRSGGSDIRLYYSVKAALSSAPVEVNPGSLRKTQ